MKMVKRCLALMLALCLSALCLPAAVLAEENALTPAQVVEALRGGEEELDALYARFTADMQAAVPRSSLPILWAQLERAGGAYECLLDDLTSAEQAPYRIYTQTASMASMNLTVTLVLDNAGLVAGLQFTPAVKMTAPTGAPAPGMTEEEVQVGAEPWLLPGTLTMPASDAPVPAVVLVHGSGPNDRDETVGATHLFADLAEALSARGIAVLRYDKRTLVYGAEMAQSPDYAALTVEEETIQDAIHAAKLLQADPRIDGDRIYLLGHSLGAMLAPRIAAESEGLFCGLILASGTNQTLAEIMRRQNLDACDAVGLDETQKAAVSAAFEAEMALLDGMNAEEAMSAETSILTPAYYFWEMQQHPAPADYLTALALPTLLINGERDFQVTVQEGMETWKQVLDVEHTPWLTCLWPDVNHLLMQPEAENAAGTTSEYLIPCNLDAGVAETIADFILTSGGNDR